MINLEKLTDEEKNQYEEYLKNHFTELKDSSPDTVVLSFLQNWKTLAELAEHESAANLLNMKVIPSRPCSFIDPENISIQIYNSTAGEIPVIRIKNVNDFESFVTNLVYKGERPENISSTGASFIFGKNTRLIVLSNKPYSNVSAKTLNLDEEDWKEKSMKIRLEHECTHFYTKTHFGTAQNHLHDELMADFFGLYEAFGEYKAEYFEYFMGTKGTEGSRLRCYIPDCSVQMMEVLKETASVCAHWLENWSISEDFNRMTKEERINFLCKIKLTEIMGI